MSSLVLWNDIIGGTATPMPNQEATNSWARNRYDGIPFDDTISKPGPNQRLYENVLYQANKGQRLYSNDVDVSLLNKSSYPISYIDICDNWVIRPPLIKPECNLNVLFATVQIRAAVHDKPVVAHFDLVYDGRDAVPLPFLVGNYNDSFFTASARIPNISPPQITAQYVSEKAVKGCAFTRCGTIIGRDFANDFNSWSLGGSNVSAMTRLPLPEPPNTQTLYSQRGGEFNITLQELFEGNYGRDQAFNTAAANCQDCWNMFQVYRNIQGMVVYRFNPVLSNNCVLNYLSIY